jgi:DNA cross-link repair 1B protein
MHLLGIDDNEDIFTTQTSLTRVRAVPKYSLTIATLEALNTVCPTIGIMPSGLPWLWRSSEGKARSSGKLPGKSIRCEGQGSGVGTIEMDYDPLSPPKLFEKDSYALPYSDHACFAELDDFVQTVRPSAVIGIVSSSSYYVNPQHHFSHLCGDELCTDRKSVENSGHNGSLAPKRRPSGSKTPRRRMIKISSATLYRSRVIMRRKGSCGARITEHEEPISAA